LDDHINVNQEHNDKIENKIKFFNKEKNTNNSNDDNDDNNDTISHNNILHDDKNYEISINNQKINNNNIKNDNYYINNNKNICSNKNLSNHMSEEGNESKLNDYILNINNDIKTEFIRYQKKSTIHKEETAHDENLVELQREIMLKNKSKQSLSSPENNLHLNVQSTYSNSHSNLNYLRDQDDHYLKKMDNIYLNNGNIKINNNNNNATKNSEILHNKISSDNFQKKYDIKNDVSKNINSDNSQFSSIENSNNKSNCKL